MQASFDSNFDTYRDTTFTTKFAPTISAVSVGSITKTTAVATVIIANPDDTTQTVQLQYRIKDPQGNWSSTQTEDTTTGSATINLTGLTAGTTYDVEVSLASGFGDTQTTTFTTKFEPSISAVSIGNVTQTTASAAISIDNADGSTQTVHLQYREKDATPPASWTSAQTVNSTTSAASIPISGLTADKPYEVEAWLASDVTMKVTATFTTLEDPNGTPTPSVSSVGVSNITMTTATATVNIANPGATQNAVKLRYSVDGATNWTNLDKSDTGSTVSLSLTSLAAGTTYEVEAWLANDATKKVTATFTTSPAPSISSIGVGGITKISATATVNIANPGTAQNTVNLRYSVDGEDSWTDHTKTETGSTVSFPLSGLTAGTTYEVEAWLGSDTGNKATATFTTTQAAAETPPPPPPQRNNPPPQRSPVNPTPPVIKSPEVSSVSFADILQTSANATVNIMYAGTSQKTVRLHYRVKDTTDWSTPPKSENTSGSSWTFALTSLTAATTYEVQAWLNSNSPPSGTQTYTFDTLANDPGISDLKFENVGQTSATAMVKIANAGTRMKEVYLKHSMDGTDEWSQLPFPTITYKDDTSIPLTGLQEETTYDVAVALTDDFNDMVMKSFTTLPSDPSLLGVSVGSITQTTAVATVNVANPGNAQTTVHLKYSIKDANSWTKFNKIATTGSENFNLTGLTPGTMYEVQASLSRDFTDASTATFTTLPSDPSLLGVSVGSITQTTAVATVNVANPGNAKTTDSAFEIQHKGREQLDEIQQDRYHWQ